MHRILYCFLLTFLLITMPHAASAVVGDIIPNCDYGTQDACNAADGCWWNLWVGDGVEPACVSCSNKLPSDATKTRIAYTGVKGKVTNLDDWKGEIYESVFCPYELNCVNQIPVSTPLTSLLYAYQCGTCTGNAYAVGPTSGSYLITKYPGGTDGIYSIAVATATVASAYTINCRECGINAHVNNDHTNCDCDLGYRAQLINSEISTNVGVGDCNIPIVYTIKLAQINGTESTLPERTIYYKFGVGYDHESDGDFNGTGNIHTTVKVDGTLDKKYLVGWSTEQNSTEAFLDGNTLNPSNHGKNIIEYCTENPEKCTRDSGSIVLYPVWGWKTYKIIYKNETHSTQSDDIIGTYNTPAKILTNQDLKEKYYCRAADVVPCDFDGDLAPTGKFFVGWRCENCADTSTRLNAEDVIPEPTNEYEGGILRLNAEYGDCPAGYYCSNNTQYPCPQGSTSNSGAKSISECFLLGGTTQFCSTFNNNGMKCITLPVEWGQELKYIKQD